MAKFKPNLRKHACNNLKSKSSQTKFFNLKSRVKSVKLKKKNEKGKMRVVILDPPLHYFFDEFAVVSRVLHLEVPHFILKAIRLSSLHDKNYVSPGGPHRGHPGSNMVVNHTK